MLLIPLPHLNPFLNQTILHGSYLFMHSLDSEGKSPFYRVNVTCSF